MHAMSHLTAALVGGELVELLLRRQEAVALAGTSRHRAAQEERQRVERRREHERDETDRERDEADRLVPSRRPGPPPGENLCRAGGEEGDGGERRQKREVLRREQLARVRGDDREIERDRSPHSRRGQRDPRESTPQLVRDTRPLDPPRLAPTLGLGERQRSGRGDRSRAERDVEAAPQRVGSPLREHTRSHRSDRTPARLCEPREQRRPTAVAARVELDQRCRRSASDHPDGEPLHRPRAVQPCRAGRECEQHERTAGDCKPADDHRTPSDPVGQAAEQDQRRDEHEGVRGEDRRQHEAGKAEALRVHRIQRGRDVRARHQHEPRAPDRQRLAHSERVPRPEQSKRAVKPARTPARMSRRAGCAGRARRSRAATS